MAPKTASAGNPGAKASAGIMTRATTGAPAGVCAVLLAAPEEVFDGCGRVLVPFAAAGGAEAAGAVPRTRSLGFCRLLDDEGGIVDQVLVARPAAGLRVVTGHGGEANLRALVERFASLGFREVSPGEFPVRPWPGCATTVARAVDLLLPRAVTEFQVACLLELRERGVEVAGRAAPAALRDAAAAERFLRRCFPEVAPLFGEHLLAITGAANVGKSSVFNLLVGEERSLVHATPGATLDPVRRVCDLGGLAVEVADLAPLDGVELPGGEEVRERCRRILGAADCVLLVLDAGREPGAADAAALERVLSCPRLVVAFNRTHLPGAAGHRDACLRRWPALRGLPCRMLANLQNDSRERLVEMLVSSLAGG